MPFQGEIILIEPKNSRIKTEVELQEESKRKILEKQVLTKSKKTRKKGRLDDGTGSAYETEA